MTTKIKICGITRLEDARYAAAAGADYLGFIQYPKSPRYIEPPQAKAIIDWVYGPQSVGVFVNEEPEAVLAAADAAGFALVQLHGHETPEACALVREHGRAVIKAFHVMHDASTEQVRALLEPYAGAIDYVLLDTHHTSLWGGTGESFNWRLVRDLVPEYDVFLAGGIGAHNVEDALRMRPFALDLSSSVEQAPGIKDFDKLGAFFDAFHAAREAETP